MNGLGIHRLFGALFLGMCLHGCGNDAPTTPVAGKVSVMVSASQYSKTHLDYVSAILSNASADTVYVFECTAVATLEREEQDGTWVDLGPWYFMCDGPAWPLPIESTGFRPLPTIPSEHVAGLATGRYRIRVAVYADSNMGTLLPEEQRVSRAFSVTD